MDFFDKIGMAGELMADPQSSPQTHQMPHIDSSQAGELMSGALGGGISKAIIGGAIGGLLGGHGHGHGGHGDLGPTAGELMAPAMPGLPSDHLPHVDASTAGELMTPGPPSIDLPSDYLPHIDPSMAGELF